MAADKEPSRPPLLTAKQAEVQRRLARDLREDGVRIRGPAEVYGWLLDQVGEVELQIGPLPPLADRDFPY